MDGMTAFTARVALIGDRSPHVRAHDRIPHVLDALREREGIDLDAYWISTTDAEDATALKGFDGIWMVPGSPYASEHGALTAARTAREERIPLLATCGGFQHVLLEYARNVCGLTEVRHGEVDPDAAELLVVELACSLAGREGAVRLEPGTLAARLLGRERSIERYYCSYGLNPAYLDILRDHGLRFTGFDDEGDVRVAELPDHPFFFCSLFQPELSDEGSRAHPFIRGFARAAADRATTPPAEPPVATTPSR
jgi:CTP synthase (UTP-ammonia lyase)